MALKGKEVAKILGISPAALSLIINNKPGISNATRQRILNELHERGYDYLINEAAEKSSASEVMKKPGKKPNTTISNIAFVNYQVSGKLLGLDSFFPLIINGIEEMAHKEGYNITFMTVYNDKIAEGLEYIRSSNCCGFIVFATEMQQEGADSFKSLGIPYVILDNNFNDDTSIVKVNNEQGTYIGVKHLWNMGHRRIGYLRSGVPIQSFNERCAMAIQAMKEFGTETPEKYIYTVGYPTEDAYLKMKALLKKEKNLPTAFMADNDLVAAGAMKACREMDIRVPEDLSFVGFDDRPVCTIIDPAMTSLRLSREHFGAEAVTLLVRMMQEKLAPGLRVEINLELVERDSVAKLL